MQKYGNHKKSLEEIKLKYYKTVTRILQNHFANTQAHNNRPIETPNLMKTENRRILKERGQI